MNHSENIHVQEVNEHALQEQAETLTDTLPGIEEEALEEVMGAAGNLKAIIYSASGKDRNIVDHSAPPSPNPQNPGIFGTASRHASLSRSFSAPTILTGRSEHYQRKMDLDLDSRRYGDYAAPPRPLTIQ
jgi:hypothetical protein